MEVFLNIHFSMMAIILLSLLEGSIVIFSITGTARKAWKIEGLLK